MNKTRKDHRKLPKRSLNRACLLVSCPPHRQLRSTLNVTPRHSYAFVKSKPYSLCGISGSDPKSHDTIEYAATEFDCLCIDEFSQPCWAISIPIDAAKGVRKVVSIWVWGVQVNRVLARICFFDDDPLLYWFRPIRSECLGFTKELKKPLKK